MFSIGVIVRTALSYGFRLFPIKRNKILISNFDGKGYGDNPKYICEALLKSNVKYDIVWVVNDINDSMPEGVRRVRNNSIRSIFEAVTSKVWIDNYRKKIWIRKRRNQVYFQTWHAGIGFKKAEMAAGTSLDKSYICRAKNDSRMADFFLSGSKWETDKYSKYYWFNGNILMTGVPKHDLLKKYDYNKITAVKNRLNLPINKKLILYAPTFRKDMKDISIYDLNWKKVLIAISQKFGGEWLGAVRLHPGLNLKTKSDRLDVIDLSDYPDAQEILMVTDILITDYSSIIFDFAFTQRPAFIYAPDLKEYINDRDVFFNMMDLPFSLASSNDQLVDVINAFDDRIYQFELESFIYTDCGAYKCQHASDMVGKIIERIVKDKKPYYNNSLIAYNNSDNE